MDKQNYEVAIIGGGIIGSFIFSGLARRGVSVVLLEATEDVANGATKANSAIIHAGYDCAPGTKKAFFNVRGNALYEEEAARLGEKIVKTGSLVVAPKSGLSALEKLLNQGITNGVKGLKILNRTELLALEPHLAEGIEYGLFAPSAKLVSPYNFAISLCEEAIANGGVLKLNFKVEKIKRVAEGFVLSSNTDAVLARFVVNCAGAGCAEINKLAGAEKLKLNLVKGEYLILDKSEFGVAKRPIFPLPSEKGKGILVLPTVAGNTLCGPTAQPISTFETSVTAEGLSQIKRETSKMVNGLNFKKTIKLYAGVRVKCGDDFIVEFSKKVPHFFITAGISSPGLASAPAIAEYVIKSLLGAGVVAHKHTPKNRRPYTDLPAMTKQEINELIAKNPKYGRLICRCENITQGEIEEVLVGGIRPLTVEGVKRRLRPTMGRCQGSFCMPQIIEIMARAYKCKPEDVCVRGQTPLVTGSVKEGGIYED